MKLVVATTTWKRPKLTRAVLEWWLGLSPSICGVSCGDGMYLEEGRWAHSRSPNKPLGAKHNRMLRAARSHNPDAVLVINSDTIVEPRLIENTVRELEAGALWTQPKELYFWHPLTNRVSKAAQNSLTGAARAYSARLLDMINWKLWDDDAQSKLDGNALKNIEKLVRSTRTVFGDAHKGHYHMLGAREVEGAVLDIKSDVNLWPYDDAVAITRAKPVDPSILERFEIERLDYAVSNINTLFGKPIIYVDHHPWDQEDD